MRIFPITTKIILVFTVFILVSNISSNYINLLLNRSALLEQMRQLLIKDLKDIYNFANNQHLIYDYNKDFQSAMKNIEEKSLLEYKNKNSIALGIKDTGSLIFEASKIRKYGTFNDAKALKKMLEARAKNIFEGFETIVFNQQEYFAVYKYNAQWDAFILRGEELNEFYEESRTIFRNISVLILVLSILCAVIGIYLLRYILRFVGIMTSSIMKMSKNQELGNIDLKGAPNDEITFLGLSFNSLSTTVNNLMNIFKKFANKDVVQKAYQEREVRLEGSQKDLTCLFSDIKSFTYMTETLGTDIINLLNLHYDKAIREIFEHDGIIGSIIGDALLAVYGVLQNNHNKSYQAIISAYKIQAVAKNLRARMQEQRLEIEQKRGPLTEDEERVYKAVLIEVGVGIDGGLVFYGNIGSHERMTNTVIGDNVNSASRLEGLTRIYKVPVICSEYVKEDVEKNMPGHGLFFLEIDMVQVKGKTVYKKIYWPLTQKSITEEVQAQINFFTRGLELYYEGKWSEAKEVFRSCEMPLAEVFKERTASGQAPDNWNGVWAMTSK